MENSQENLIDLFKPDKKKLLTFILLAIVISLGLQSFFGVSPYWYVVSSQAMEPNYSKGDIVIVRSTSYNEIEKGDVVVHEWIQGKVPAVMRVISKNTGDGTFRTQGDNNPRPNPKNFTSEELKAKVIGKIPFLGRLEKYYIGPVLRIFLLYLLACLISFYIDSLSFENGENLNQNKLIIIQNFSKP